jgi:Predicted AAA-ATPase/PD-(D/E)XK nuclease superfamily
MKKIPIGITDYKELIEGNYYYVDKTLLIKELLATGDKVTLIARPRRFGKTLNLSMLQYFFDCSNSGIKNDLLFYNMHIWRYPELRAHQRQYPIIFLTFKDTADLPWQEAYNRIALVIAKEYTRHKYLLDDNCLEDFEKDIFNHIRMHKGSFTQISDSLLFLTELLHRHHNKRVMVLIDEYDAPIHAAYSYGSCKQGISFIRALLTAPLKDNKYLERGILTGVLRTAKEGIFSGLNNLSIFTITDPDFADKFGFTHQEVIELLADMSIDISHTAIKQWYNGYTFGFTDGLYNPWSILNYVRNNGLLKPYWVNTSDNALIKKLIAQANKTVKSELERLLNGDTLVQEVNESITLSEIELNPTAIWSLLLYTGYLTYTTCESKGNTKVCSLIIPNNEIYHLYTDLIKSIFTQATEGEYGTDLLKALINGNTQLFSQLLQNFILNSISAYDLPSNQPEKSYHLFVLGLLVILSDSYEVKSNRESGYGRYDIMLIPKYPEANGIIIEFKKVSPGETLEDTAQQGLDQIISKQYSQELCARGITHIITYGIAFEGKKVFVKSSKLDL